MSVASHTKARQPGHSVKSRRANGSTRVSGQAKPSGNGSVPPWACDAVFPHARIIAWEGTLNPLCAFTLYPPGGSFIDSLLLTRKGSIIRWRDSIHPLDRERVCNRFADIGTLPFYIEYRLINISGGVTWVRHSIIAETKNGRLVLGRGFIHDIQTEKKLEMESLRVSEREQNRIGQDLHDDLCQVLAGVSCLMRVAESRLAGKAPEEVASLSEINKEVVGAMHRTRALTHGLFPGKIQIADVRGALLELASQVRARFQVEVKTKFIGRFPQHTADQIIQIYRLTQEAISNAIKHGHATCIAVHLEAKPKTMFLSIVDNGDGLSQAKPGDEGVGLHIMQYRTHTLGGELDIRNAPKRGVVVSLHYPFKL